MPVNHADQSISCFFLFFNVDPSPFAVLFWKFPNPSVMKENRAFPETDFHECAAVGASPNITALLATFQINSIGEQTHDEHRSCVEMYTLIICIWKSRLLAELDQHENVWSYSKQEVGSGLRNTQR